MDKQPYNEKALLLQVANGDEKAFRQLFDAYHNRLYFFVLRVTLSKESAEDIVQDTFFKIWLLRDQLKKVSHFKAYIFRMAQNAVLTSLHRKALEVAILEEKIERLEAETELTEKLNVKLIKELIQKTIETLPEQQKKVYKLRREEGYGIKEISYAMNISQVTVKRHLTEAQKTLRLILQNFLSQ